jgi:hypothetical protein
MRNDRMTNLGTKIDHGKGRDVVIVAMARLV